MPALVTITTKNENTEKNINDNVLMCTNIYFKEVHGNLY